MKNQSDYSQLQGRLFTLANQTREIEAELTHILADTQVQGRLLNMTNQIEDVQTDIAGLLAQTQRNSEQMHLLTQHLIHAEPDAKLHENLAELVTQVETNQEKLDDLTTTVKKLARTQFKANTLGDSKGQQIHEVISLLREIVTKREELKEAQTHKEQQHRAELRLKARGELAADFLPVLDGIELALKNGQRLFQKEEHHEGSEKTTGIFRRLFRKSAVKPERHDEQEPSRSHREIEETIAGWLNGLEIIRERFISLLAGEGIEPIPDIGEQFDPHLHVAVETEICSDVPENSIVAVIRKGYTQQERVLRYSEVIVAKAPSEGIVVKASQEKNNEE